MIEIHTANEHIFNITCDLTPDFPRYCVKSKPEFSKIWTCLGCYVQPRLYSYKKSILKAMCD